MKVITTSDIYYNLDDDAKKAAITTGIGAATALGTALASRQKRQLSEAEQRCGKKPKFGSKKKQEWQDCVNKSIKGSIPASTSPVSPPPSTENKNKTLIYVGIGVVVLAVVGVVIWKMKTAKR